MAGSGSRARSALVGLLFVLACLAITVTTVGVWAHQTLLNTDRFVAVTSRVVAEPEVQAVAADKLAAQIVVAADVQGRIAGVLPPNQAFLAVPMTSAVQSFLDRKLTDIFATERAQTALETAIRFSHQRLVRLLRDQGDVVSVEGTTATIDLLPIAVMGLQALQENGILPASVQIPDVSTEADRAAAIANLESRLGRQLPEGFGTIQVADVKTLASAQSLVRIFDLVVIGLIVLTIAFAAGTILLARRRLRMVGLLAVGFVFALLLARVIIRSALQGLIAALATGDAAVVRTMVTDLVSDLASWTWYLVLLLLVVAVIAVIAGRPRWLSGAADAASSGDRGDAVATWAGAHRDGLLWTVGILAVVAIVWLALSPDLALLAGIGLWIASMLLGRRGKSDAPTTPPAAPPEAPQAA